MISDNAEYDEQINCEEKGDFFCECDGSCIPQSQVCNGENDCCTTMHGIGSNNVICADPKSVNDFEAPDEVNCPSPASNHLIIFELPCAKCVSTVDHFCPILTRVLQKLFINVLRTLANVLTYLLIYIRLCLLLLLVALRSGGRPS